MEAGGGEFVRVRAYYLWEGDGRGHGRDLEHWFRAEAEFIAEASAARIPTPDRIATPQSAATKMRRETEHCDAAREVGRRHDVPLAGGGSQSAGSEPATSRVAEAVRSSVGKYLTLTLASTQYGIEVQAVREIITMMDTTPVPRTPAFVAGVMNLRGKILPVVDLRQLFGMPAVADDEETRIVVVEVTGDEVGIMVDRVCELLDIHESSVEEVPSFGSNVSVDFVRGMAKTSGGEIILLLDIAGLLSSAHLN